MKIEILKQIKNFNLIYHLHFKFRRKLMDQLFFHIHYKLKLI